MQEIFREHLDEFVLVFFDDILVYSKNAVDHEMHVRKVLEILRTHKLFAKKSKCTFSVDKVEYLGFVVSKVEYLGFVVSKEGISADPAKVQAVIDWPEPRTVKEVRGFLGLTGWYRIFIPKYAKLASPLTALLKKDQPFQWTPMCQSAFDKLKAALVTSPVLKLPDFSKPFEVITDASGFVIGGVLMQEGHAIAYESRKLRNHARNYATHDLELLAVTYALKLWRHYLLGQRFTLVTDHQSLKWIFTQENLNMRQRRWMQTLQEFDFEIKYRPGKANVVADALSRKASLLAISIISSPLVEEVKGKIHSDSYFAPNITLLLQESKTPKELKAVQGYCLSDECLYFNNRLCIPKDGEIKKRLLVEAHDSPIARHPSYIKTFMSLKKSFFWPGLKKDVLHHVRQCLVCQRVKAERVKMPGMLQPLDIPLMKWESISMDFVTGLPTIRSGYNSIFVVVDRLTKVAHLIPVKVTFSAMDIAKIFIKEIFRLHGLPRRIVSDRDAKFTSRFWTAFFEAVGTSLNLSTAYHPETDGQTERVNQVIEDILRSCGKEPQKWMSYLHLVEFAYNASYHRSIGMSPFKALYGQDCLTPLAWSDPLIRVEVSKQMLDEMDHQMQTIRKDIKAAQDRQKQYADAKRSVRTFEEGDMVFLRVRPKRSSISLGKYKKLSPRYCGPYVITRRIGDQAYKLLLPPQLKVHNVFHVSLLKKYVPDPSHVLDEDQIALPTQGQLELEPEKILDMREKALRNRVLREFLVKWKFYPVEDATWEKEEDLEKDYPLLAR